MLESLLERPLSNKTRKLPLSTTRSTLLSGKSDHSFRELLYNLFTISNHLEQVRRHLGARIGLSGPQYNLMMAVEKLARKGYINKHHDHDDMRVSRLAIGQKGWTALGSLFPELPQINDLFFAIESREEFEILRGTVKKMVESSQRTLALINVTAPQSSAGLLARMRRPNKFDLEQKGT